MKEVYYCSVVKAYHKMSHKHQLPTFTGIHNHQAALTVMCSYFVDLAKDSVPSCLSVFL